MLGLRRSGLTRCSRTRATDGDTSVYTTSLTCASCGADIRAEARFCRTCGTSVPVEGPPVEDPPVEVEGDVEKIPDRKEAAAAEEEPSASERGPLVPLLVGKPVWSPRKAWTVETRLPQEEAFRLFEQQMTRKAGLLRRFGNYFRRVRWVTERTGSHHVHALCRPTGLVSVGIGRTRTDVDVSQNVIELRAERLDGERTAVSVEVASYTTWWGLYLFPPIVYAHDYVRAVRRADRTARVTYPWSRVRMVMWGAVVVAVVALVAGASSDSGGSSAFGSGGVGFAATSPSTAPDVTTSAVATPTTVAAATSTALPTRPSADPSTLATEINALEAVLHDASSSPTRMESAGRLQQLAFRRLLKQPELQPTVLSQLTPAARSNVEAAISAGNALTSLVAPQQKLPAWTIVAPASADELLGIYREAERTYGVRWQYLAAIHLVESRMGRIRGNSSAGAQGPMQFIPATWSRYGSGDINSNHDSIMAAARLLVANGAPSNMANALYRYNPDQDYVVAIEAYVAAMTREPREFYGYYHWQVLYKHVDGTLVLPVGYPAVSPEVVE